MDPDKTHEPSVVENRGGEPAVIGLVHVFTAGTPTARALSLDGERELGRGSETLGPLADPRMSRRHARVRVDGDRVIVTDAGSQNGTAVDGEQLASGASREVTRVLRLGDSLFVPTRDLRGIERLGVTIDDGFVRGPALQRVIAEVQHVAKLGPNLHVHGESGSGKEGVARAFHAASGFANGPFVAVNCATIAASIAERLLFGAKRGAYSGADIDAMGFFQSAERGTLFLDEIVELDLLVQAKLLRAIETHEVTPVGATEPRRIELNICSATHRSLRKLVAGGKLRDDLFFRIGRPEVTVPPLRDRIEEIPFLLHRAIAEAAPGRELHISLVEACMLRPWPGNVRELLVEARSAAHKALLRGDARVEASHLDATGGSTLEAGKAVKIETRSQKPLDPEARERIVEALRQCNGKVAAAARVLGIHRTQLRRLLEAHGIDADAERE